MAIARRLLLDVGHHGHGEERTPEIGQAVVEVRVLRLLEERVDLLAGGQDVADVLQARPRALRPEPLDLLLGLAGSVSPSAPAGWFFSRRTMKTKMERSSSVSSRPGARPGRAGNRRRSSTSTNCSPRFSCRLTVAPASNPTLRTRQERFHLLARPSGATPPRRRSAPCRSAPPPGKGPASVGRTCTRPVPNASRLTSASARLLPLRFSDERKTR